MNVRFTQSSSQQIFAITRHFVELDRNLGLQLLDELDGLMDSLAASPKMGAIVSSKFRRVLLRQFPYAVYYRIDSESGSIWVEAVVHQRRHPSHWRNGVQEEPAIYQLAA